MAYLANGTEGELFERDNCSDCVHWGDDDKGCPVFLLHLLWNYDQLGEDHASVIKRQALNCLAPRSGSPNVVDSCAMRYVATQENTR